MHVFLSCWAGYLVAGLFAVVLLSMTGLHIETISVLLLFLTCTLLLALGTTVLLKQCALEKRLNGMTEKEPDEN